MGDVSSEPTMEEILSSIKRVIEESESTPAAGRPRRPARTGAPVVEAEEPDEVLELSERVPFPEAPRAEAPPPPRAVEAPPARPQLRADPIISSTVAEASRGSLEALSRLVVKPDVAGSDTLEALVREMLRPMLRDWLDSKLPGIVEAMVAKEIERITGRTL